MLWIRFDDSDHFTPAPSFCLPGILDRRTSKSICLADFHENCNLALFFTHGSECPGCLPALRAFAERQADYEDREARVLAVFPEPLETLAGHPGLAGLPFPLLSDPGNLTRQAYTGLMVEGLVEGADSLLYVLDRYNAPYAALANNGRGEGADLFARPDVQEDILSWFEFIGVQCPE